MRENRTLEYKSEITKSFLKTVSAFANYGSGKILFGVDDDGTVVGISNAKQECLKIENLINDSISPVPNYSLSLNEKTNVITLSVNEGQYKPYLCNSVAYRRSDTSTIPVDRVELSRLVLEGNNTSYEEQKCSMDKPKFEVLQSKLKEALNIGKLSKDVLKTFELYSDADGYNKAAELLADKNSCCGIDAIRFGQNISIILDRETYEHMSILSQYDSIVEMYRKYYQYEEVVGSTREKRELIPEAAFREAIANALVHRMWDVEAHINVSMFENGIEITSPGGLPNGISLEEYLEGGLSIPRNPIISYVFLRLNLIERFGTGIRRISEAYVNSQAKPVYTVTERMIRIVLPVITIDSKFNSDEGVIIDLLTKYGNMNMSSSQIADMTKMGKTKVVSILNKLVDEGYVRRSGRGRGTGYSKIK